MNTTSSEKSQRCEAYVSLMKTRDYIKIIKMLMPIQEVILNDPNPVEYRHMSIALLRANRIDEAISHYKLLIDVIPTHLQNDFDYNELGAAYWLTDQPENAVECWQKALKCKYGDGARNMTPALILYYAAVRLHDRELRSQAVTAIEKKLKTGWSRNWPAPLGRYLLDKSSTEDVLKELDRQAEWTHPDELCRFDFYRGIKLLEADQHEQARTAFEHAIQQPGQITSSTEFVLANYELNRLRHSIDSEV